jgi:cytochrome d ubiquinol oxidase subunit II
MDINTLWFLIMGFALIVYVILDGYDLGIGILCLFVPRHKHEYREQLIRIVGPYWDGNEVWLIVFGGMLFAVFPRIYATLLSALYLPFIVLLIFFIIRGISIPSRNRYNNSRWHSFWDLSFGISSLMIAFLLGLVAANLIRGITTNENGFMKLNLARLIRPFSLWMGVFSITLLCMHGAIHAGRKCAGDIKSYCRKAGFISWLLMLIFAAPAEITVLSHDPADVFKKHFVLFSLLVVLLIFSIVYIPLGLKSGKFNKTFAASSLAIGCFLALLYLYSYPNLLRSVEPARNLTIYNAASSSQAMLVALILTIIAMPIVIGYTIYAHHTLAQYELPATETSYDTPSP